MTDNLIICPVCGSNACYEAKTEEKTIWHCFGYGFASNSDQHIEKIDLEKVEAVLPDL